MAGRVVLFGQKSAPNFIRCSKSLTIGLNLLQSIDEEFLDRALFVCSLRANACVLEMLDVHSLRAFGRDGEITRFEFLLVFTSCKTELHESGIQVLVARDCTAALLSLAHRTLLLVALRIDHDLNFLRGTFPFALLGVFHMMYIVHEFILGAKH